MTSGIGVKRTWPNRTALVGGVGGVHLRNDKGVTITLQGFKGGLEVSANITKVVITLDQSRSTPD
jgi:hypothetical protein